jgi:hypothetical protein
VLKGDLMHIIHEATVRNTDGVIDISIVVVANYKRKSYTYHLNSEEKAKEFHSLIRNRKRHGQAINLLNRSQIK